MDVGLQMIFSSYGWRDVSDEQVWNEELRLARLAADLGFDVLWSVEHHFNDYSFCPDNLQLMSYLAAECPDDGLGTAAVTRHFASGARLSTWPNPGFVSTPRRPCRWCTPGRARAPDAATGSPRPLGPGARAGA